MSTIGRTPRRLVRRLVLRLGTGATLAALAACGRGDGSAPRTKGTAGTASASASGEMKDMPGMEMPGMATGGGEGTVHLSADQIRTFGVTFGTVERRTLESTVRAAGIVAVDESRVAQVAPKVSGFAERLYVDVTGRAVRRGEPLLELYSPELLAAQEELLVARGLDRTVGESSIPGVPVASTDLVAAARRRLQLLDVSDAQIDDVLRTGRARRTVTLSAPASGVVLAKDVVRGQAVEAGRSLYTIADLSRVWVEAALREADAAAVRVGSAADVDLAAAPGRTFKGRVAFVYPVLDSVSRTVRARVEVANSDGVLKPGMYATVRLTTPTRTALAVPSAAVIRTGERAVVFVDMGGGELMPHEVTLGGVSSEFTEVLSGVDAGQRVVTSAQYLLESESNVAEVMRSMIGQTGASDMTDMPGMTMPADKGADVKAALKSGTTAAPPRR